MEESLFRSVFESIRLLSSRQRAGLLTLTLLRVATQGLDLVGIAAVGLLGSMLASGLNERDEASFFGLEITIQSSATYLWVTLAITGLFLAKSALSTILLKITTSFLAKLEASFAAEIADSVFGNDLSRSQALSRGDIQWAIGYSTTIAFSSLLYSASTLVVEGALFLMVLVALTLLDPITAMIVLVYFGSILLFFQISINRRLRKLGERIRTNSIETANVSFDLTNTFRELFVLGRRAHMLERLKTARTHQAVDQGSQKFLFGVPRYFLEVALMIGALSVISWQFVQGALSDGLVVTAVFIAGGLRLMAAMLPLQSALAGIRSSTAQAAKAQEIIAEAKAGARDKQDESAGRGGRNPEEDGAASISIDNVSFSYPGSEANQLSKISLEIDPGDFVAIVGRSGAGKSTLAELILGLISPSSGEIRISGVAPHRFVAANPGRIGYVPQNPGLIRGTLLENVTLGLNPSQIDHERVREVLSFTSMLDFAQSLPSGWDTDLGEQTEALSGGQRQRLGLARALYSQPRLIILDEATSALDAETESAISKAIESLLPDVTLLVIAHRLSTVQKATTTVVLKDGEIDAVGSFESLTRKNPTLKKFVELLEIKD